MAIYYEITAPGIETVFNSTEEACLYIRANKISEYTVYMKDDSQILPQRTEGSIIFPLQPMCKDITSEIKSTLAYYDKLEKGNQ